MRHLINVAALWGLGYLGWLALQRMDAQRGLTEAELWKLAAATVGVAVWLAFGGRRS